MLIDIVMAILGIGVLVVGLGVAFGMVIFIISECNKPPARQQFDEEQKAIRERRNARKKRKRRNVYIAKLMYFITLKGSCYSCCKAVGHIGPRRCPACEAVFEGDGWKGFKKHWNSEHTDIDTYDHLMANMCSDHKTKERKKAGK